MWCSNLTVYLWYFIQPFFFYNPPSLPNIFHKNTGSACPSSWFMHSKLIFVFHISYACCKTCTIHCTLVAVTISVELGGAYMSLSAFWSDLDLNIII